MTNPAGLAVALLLQAAQTAQPDTVVTGVDFLSAALARIDVAAVIRAGLWLFVGIPLLLAITRWVKQWVSSKYSPQQAMVVGKLIVYPGVLLIVVLTLMELSFNLAPLLGAAGVVGIAVGFASQTSVSNVISGFFLIGEKPFEVGDVIQVGETVGVVMSIDTLSVKLRTFDNRFIRIPNETIVKSQVTTVTRFPIRRVDLNVGVAYKEDIPRVREVLMDVARANPRALMEPAPTMFFDGYGASSLDLRLTVWTMRENFFSLKNTLLEEIKARFDSEGIEIPFPHSSLYAGEATGPFPIRIVSDRDLEDAELAARAEEAVSRGADAGGSDTSPYQAPPPDPADPLEDEPR